MRIEQLVKVTCEKEKLKRDYYCNYYVEPHCAT